MSEADPELYAPNQQLVRPDRSGPAEEGEGGTSPETEPDPKPAGPDAMTKDELLAYAAERGVAVDPSMTKAEIRAAIDGQEVSS